MVTCRSISPATWEQARKALVFYFQRRVGFARAEDLAHDTLAAFWLREDFQFQEEGDFLRVCYGFAENILKAALRKDKSHLQDELQESSTRESNAFGLNSVEMRICLDKLLEAAQDGLLQKDWELIENYVTLNLSGDGRSQSSNRYRVALHRALGRWAKLVAEKSGKRVTDDAGST